MAERQREKLKEVLRTLTSLKGVKHAFYLTPEMRAGLLDIEKRYPAIGPLTVENDGVKKCLKRQHVGCIIKDKTFRGPPHPTVVLVNDKSETIGREILPGEKIKTGPGTKTLMLGKDFVVFYDKDTSHGARFVLPPVDFIEVERMEGTSCVISSSPSTPGDFFLRKKAHIEDDPKLASILIGFDLC